MRSVEEKQCSALPAKPDASHEQPVPVVSPAVPVKVWMNVQGHTLHFDVLSSP